MNRPLWDVHLVKTKTKDKVIAGIASRVLSNMDGDERIVRGLLDTNADSVPKRLLLVATSFILKKACGRLKHARSHGRVTTGVYMDSQVGIVDTGMGTPSARNGDGGCRENETHSRRPWRCLRGTWTFTESGRCLCCQ